jgi:pyruvate kinase
MSRYNTDVPIYAFSVHDKTLQKMAPYRWVKAHWASEYWCRNDIETPVELLKEEGVVKTGDRLVLTFGDVANVSGGTNNLKIITVK